jgi:hypothetical protein
LLPSIALVRYLVIPPPFTAEAALGHPHKRAIDLRRLYIYSTGEYDALCTSFDMELSNGTKSGRKTRRVVIAVDTTPQLRDHSFLPTFHLRLEKLLINGISQLFRNAEERN